jgi:hypothetical protein
VPATLYHYSDDPNIAVFEPRLMPRRPEVDEAFVWAVDDAYAFTYCFPRDCPRIIIWPLESTTEADRERWFGSSDARAIAHIEWAWFEPMRATTLYRYTLPAGTFEAVGAESGPGNYVSRSAVTPLAVEAVPDLFAALRGANIEVRVLETLTPLWDVWSSSLHASGFRLAFAQGWRQCERSHRYPARLGACPFCRG